MIVCSSCQFENPSDHRYCQKCGAPLVPHSTTDEDSQAVVETPRNADLVGGNPTNEASAIDSASPSLLSPSPSEDGFDTENILHLLQEDTKNTRLAIVPAIPERLREQTHPPYFLDAQKRYEILSPIPADFEGENKDRADIELLLLDREPDLVMSTLTSGDMGPSSTLGPSSGSLFQSEAGDGWLGNDDIVDQRVIDVTQPALTASASITPVEYGDEEEDDNSDDPTEENEDVTENATFNEQLSLNQENATDRSGSRASGRATIDNLAVTYLELQDQLYPSFPRLLDVLEEEFPIVILENRDSFPFLHDAIAQNHIVMPQILHWFHEMVELWDVLVNYRCASSLLILANIRVDEDQILCLKRIHFDSLENQPSLRNLGELWQTLECYSSLPLPESLKQIYQNLNDGSILDTATLQQRLESVSNQIYQETVIEPGSTIAGETSPVFDPRDLDEFANQIRQFNSELPQQVYGDLDNPDAASSDSSIELRFMASSDDNEEMKSTSLSDDPTVVLPMQLHTLTNVGLTNIGIQREHNEDFFSIETHITTSETPVGRVCHAKGLYILCDGMGGHAAGEVASALAGEALQDYFRKLWTEELPDEATIYEGIVRANQVIFDCNQNNDSEGARRMGTTLVTLLLHDTRAAIAHVGDSRIYRFTRRQGLEQLTVDHEVGQREIGRGVDPSVAYARPDAYQLTQALGPRDEDFIRPDIQFLEMNEDTLFILGSDGLTDNDLLETYCESHIEPLISSNANLDEGAVNLIDLANQVNGHDNITVILARVKLRPKLSLLGR